MLNQFCLFAQESVGEFYQFSRLQAMSQWWHWMVLLAVVIAIIAYVVVMYRKDSADLSRGFAFLLIVLRLAAFAGILFYFFNLEKRTERKVTKNSRTLVLVDTSQSMGLEDTLAGSTAGQRRITQVVDELKNGPLLEDLRNEHDVVVYRFDQDNKPTEVASLSKISTSADGETGEGAEAAFNRSLQTAHWTALAAGGFLLVGLICGLVYLSVGRSVKREDGSWSLLASIVCLIIAAVILAIGNLRHPEIAFMEMLGLKEASFDDVESGSNSDTEGNAEDEEEVIDWDTELAARGLETRLGESLRYLVNKERGGPIAGIVLVSDGRNNAGIEHTAGAAIARLAEIPIYTVGMGSDRRPLNVRIVDLEAPQRVYPGDKFVVTGYVQGYGMAGRTVEVKLTSYPTGAAEGERTETIEAEDAVTLVVDPLEAELSGEDEDPDGKIFAVKFDVTPHETGRRTYQLTAKAPAQDTNERDDFKTANVEVVDRKTRVLIMAGGPTREFRFLRNYLYRDRDTTLDVWLQSGEPGISQESDQLLFALPEDPEELFEYDCIIAFDPDWTMLDEFDIENMEKWVAEKAGGLIVVAGPVNTPLWANVRQAGSRLNTIRSLYPVSLYSSGSVTLGLGRFGGESAWPLNFTREGMESEFLWLEDTALDSEAAWAAFDGVFGYYAVKDPKPGARVLCRFSDPSTTIDGELPIYMASHFYGAGRVFFQASGEIWRLREEDETYFETYYTKLIRWVSQGRLLRDSNRGVLLVDKDRCLLGDHVAVQAILTDAQNLPLDAPEVSANLIQPDGTRVALTLRHVKDGARDGTFAGQFTAVMEGDYRVELRSPQGDIDDLLIREVRVRVPALEIEKPERYDALLQDIASVTQGKYYVGIQAASGESSSGVPPLVNVIEPREQVAYLPGTPDRDFEQQLMMWLMALICGFLCFEWLLRRLSKLA